MTKWFWTAMALVNGAYFMVHGLVNQQEYQAICGILLLGFAVLSLVDHLRSRKVFTVGKKVVAASQKAVSTGQKQLVLASESLTTKATGIVASVKDSVATQVSRAHALYDIYKNAPQVLEQQKQMQQLFAMMEARNGGAEPQPNTAAASVDELHVRTAKPKSHGKSKAKAETRRAPQVVIEDVIDEGTSMPRFVDSKVEFMAYPMADNRPFWTMFEEFDLKSKDQSTSTLILTDNGDSEVTGKILNDYISGQIEVSFWIARDVAPGIDLFVVPRAVLLRESQMSWAVTQKIAQEYDRVLWLTRKDVVDAVAESQKSLSDVILELQPRGYSKHQ